METIAERLNYARKQFGKTYDDIGEMLDLTGSAIRLAIKRNNIKPIYINILADKLAINKNWLLTGEEQMFLANATSKVLDYFKELDEPRKETNVTQHLNFSRTRDDQDLIDYLCFTIVEQKREICQLRKNN